MGSLDDVQFRFQDAALSLHLLMVGSRRRLLVLDDHVNRGAVVAAFQSVEIFGQLILLAVSKGQSGGQQGDQSQKRDPRAPRRSL